MDTATDQPLVCALLLAGGQGRRAATAIPKQFVEVDGLPVVGHTMRCFEHSAQVADIHVVCHPEWQAVVRRAAAQAGIQKLRLLPPAGSSGIESLLGGLEALSLHYAAEDARRVWVMVHDGVRPLLSPDLIRANLSVMERHGNAITAVQSQEAYMLSTNGIDSREMLAREALWRAQTPMTFTLHFLRQTLLQRAHEGMLPPSQSLYTLVRQLCPTMPLHIAPGNELNFKLTTATDLQVMEKLLTFASGNT